jgi:hypothetical protein
LTSLDEYADPPIDLPTRDGAMVDGMDGGDASDEIEDAATCPGAGDPSLLASYTFDESDPTRIFDCSKSQLHGTIVPGATFQRVAGKRGGAIDVDGVKGCLDLGLAPMLAFGGAPFTVAAWIKPRQFSVPNDTSNPGPRWFVGHYGTATGRANGWGLGTDDSAALELKIFRDDVLIEAEATMAPMGMWTHVAGVRTPSELVVYVNGTPRAQTATATAVGTDTAARGWVGCRASPSDSFFDGAIDELRIYGRALGAAEIAALAQ